MVYSSLQVQQITSALKRANQRIAQISKTYGRGSSVYKQEAGKFLKGSYAPYVGVSKSGNIKFDIRAINKLIRSQGDSSEVQRLLAETAGIKFDAEGNMKELKGGGVSTLARIQRRTEKRLERLGEDPGDYTKAELRRKAEELAKFSENFQTSYDTFIAKYGEDKARKNPIISKLYKSGRKGKKKGKRLTYDVLTDIREEMEKLIQESQADGLKFEKDNEGEV